MAVSASIFILSILELLNTFSVYKFYNTFYEGKKKNVRIEFVSFFVYFLLRILLDDMIRTPIVLLFVNIFFFFLLSLNYHASNWRRLLSSSLMYLLIFCSELIALAIFRYPLSVVKIPTIAIYTVYSFCLNILVLVIFYLKKLINDKITSFLYHGCILFNIVSLVYIMLLMESGISISITAMLTVLMLVVDYVILELYDQQIVRSRINYEKMIQKEQINSYKKQIEIMSMYTNNSNAFRHDLMRQALILRKTLEESNQFSAIEELDNIGNLLIEIKHVKTDVVPIDSILNFKIFEAEYYNIEVNHKVIIPYDIDYNELDMTVLFGCLMDFGIEENKHISDSKRKICIDVIFELDKNDCGWLNIKFSHTARMEKMDLSDNMERIKNIESLKEKYGGELSYDSEGKDMFTIYVNLPVFEGKQMDN